MKQKTLNLISFLTSSKTFYSIVLIYFLANIIYAAFGTLPFGSDSLYYYQKASECIANGTMYPASHNIYVQYIQSPLYINFNIVLLSIYNSQSTIIIANIILNFCQLTLVYFITKKLFGEIEYARLSALLYMFYLTNIGAVIFNYTEFLFVTLLLLAFYLFLQNRITTFIFSGIALGFALDIKQMAIVFLFSLVVTHYYMFRKAKEKFNSAFLIFGFLIPVLLIGTATKIGFGEFIVTPETAAVNILIGANDDTNGAFDDDVFAKGKIGYIENYDEVPHDQKTKFYREQAIDWILAHPLKWISYLPIKIAHLYSVDDWSIFGLVHSTEWNLPKIIKYVVQKPEGKTIFENESLGFKISFILIYLYHHIFYYGLLLLIVIRFVKTIRNRKDELFIKLLPIYLFAFLGTASVLLSFGAARYKYPFIIFLMFTIIPFFSKYFTTSSLKK